MKYISMIILFITLSIKSIMSYVLKKRYLITSKIQKELEPHLTRKADKKIEALLTKYHIGLV